MDNKQIEVMVDLILSITATFYDGVNRLGNNLSSEEIIAFVKALKPQILKAFGDEPINETFN